MQVTPESLRPSPATSAPGLGVPTTDQLWPFQRSAAFRPMPRSLMWLPTAQQLRLYLADGRHHRVRRRRAMAGERVRRDGSRRPADRRGADAHGPIALLPRAIGVHQIRILRSSLISGPPAPGHAPLALS